MRAETAKRTQTSQLQNLEIKGGSTGGSRKVLAHYTPKRSGQGDHGHDFIDEFNGYLRFSQSDIVRRDELGQDVLTYAKSCTSVRSMMGTLLQTTSVFK